VRANLGGTI